MRFRLKIIFLATFLLTFFSPAYAYAGPGVAIGAIIVALTVIVAFFSSVLIRVINFIKFLLKTIRKRSAPKVVNENKKDNSKQIK